MKRYVLDMGYRHGRPGTEWDLFEVPDGDWVRYEEASEALAEAEHSAGGYHCHYDAQVVRADAAEARIEQQKKAHAERKRMIDEARVVLDDCFESGEPRCTAHALEALRRIICGTGLVAFGGCQPAAPRCVTHEVGLANLAYFKCGCRHFPQPATDDQ